MQFLKPEQIEQHNVLGGHVDDPCKNINAGHNPEMYRRQMQSGRLILAITVQMGIHVEQPQAASNSRSKIIRHAIKH